MWQIPGSPIGTSQLLQSVVTVERVTGWSCCSDLLTDAAGTSFVCEEREKDLKSQRNSAAELFTVQISLNQHRSVGDILIIITKPTF